MILLNHLITVIKLAKKSGNKNIFIGIKASFLCYDFLRILLKQGFIKNFREIKQKRKEGYVIEFRFDERGNNIIKNIQFVASNQVFSTVKISALWKKEKGQGLFVLLTPQGLLTDIEARNYNVGGKLVSIIV